jgi:hypothetical protein
MDIVERLRSLKSDEYIENLVGKAADEIERLRDRVLLLEGYLNGALNVVEGFVHCDTKEARQALGEKE